MKFKSDIRLKLSVIIKKDLLTSIYPENNFQGIGMVFKFEEWSTMYMFYREEVLNNV